MESSRIHAVLNEVLAAEACYLAARMPESLVFADLGSTSVLEAVQAMAARHVDSMRALTEVLIELDGVPDPIVGDITSADLHYMSIHVAMPRVLENQRELLDVYERAMAALDPCPKALAVVSEIAATHRANLEFLSSLCRQDVVSAN